MESYELRGQVTHAPACRAIIECRRKQRRLASQRRSLVGSVENHAVDTLASLRFLRGVSLNIFFYARPMHLA